MNSHYCTNKEGNQLTTDGKHTYHQWNIFHSKQCYHCKTRKWFKGKCPICEKKETEYCDCKKCDHCGKIIKL